MNRPTVSSAVTNGNLSRRATVSSTVTHGKLTRWASGKLNRGLTVQLTVQVVSQIVFEPFRLFLQVDRLTAQRTFCTAGNSKPMSVAMIAITTSNSMRVKARREFVAQRIPFEFGIAAFGVNEVEGPFDLSTTRTKRNEQPLRR